MQQVAFVPPPLPPKTRRPVGGESTVLNNNTTTTDVYGYSFPEVGGKSQTSTTVQTSNHVVKIRINPQQSVLNSVEEDIISEPCVRISVNSDMIQNGTMTETAPNYFFYGPFNCNNVISSGQVSPSDTLDSGTCSDLDATPPPLPKKKNAVSVTLIGHKRDNSTSCGSQGDSDNDNDSNLSYDSLNSADLPPEEIQQIKPQNNLLPQGLLKDIRDRTIKLNQQIKEKPICEIPKDDLIEEEKLIDNIETKFRLEPLEEEVTEETPKRTLVIERTYDQRKEANKIKEIINLDPNQFYDFHINENVPDTNLVTIKTVQDETFAGYKDLLNCDGSSTIRSAKGTVRGVKNRVRAGIATFLQINSTTKNYKEKDAGKVVVYTTTMGIVRETYQACMKVKQILRTLLVKYEERDVFMSGEYQAEIRDRMKCEFILVPQVFVDGQHVGDAETVERLNESGELRRILKPYKSIDVCTTCKSCGGFRLLPCPVCNGSKKSVHRNHFTTEFVALKCMNCDEVGLVKCSFC